MKLLLVTQYFWPENFRINDFLLGLREMGHEVEVLTGMPNYPDGSFFSGYDFFGPKKEEWEGIPVHRVPLLPRGRGRGWELLLNYFSFALSASLLGPFRCRGTYDCIFVYEPSPVTVGFPALALKRRTGAPIMFWVQDLWPETLAALGVLRSSRLLKLVGGMVRFIYDRCDLVLVQSEAFAGPVEALGVGSDRIRYFPNSAEALYRPMGTTDETALPVSLPAGFRVMFAGNIGAAQDFGTILEAAGRLQQYPDIHWLILGDGRLRPWVETERARRGLQANFHLLGRFPQDAMPAFFAGANAMLVTLRKEPIFALTVPAKVQSYLACGKPIIAALDGEGARIVTEAGAGLAVPAEDPAGLAAAVLAMSRMTEPERQAMGARSRGYFEKHFERSLLLHRFDGWMRELAEGRPSGGKKGAEQGLCGVS